MKTCSPRPSGSFSKRSACQHPTSSTCCSETFATPPARSSRSSSARADEVEWVAIDDARSKLVKGQVPALDALEAIA
jgi:predicted NUDIX family NTP pyrophosphohydrolase